MARPLIDALTNLHDAGHEPDLSSLFLFASTAALFSTSIKEKFLELLPNRIITESVGSSETGFGGTSIVAKGQSHTGGPRVRSAPHRRPRRRRHVVKPGSGVRGLIAKGQRPGRLLQGPEEDRRDLQDRRCPLRGPRRLRRGRGGRQRHAARPRVAVDQHRWREGLPRGGRGGAQGPPRRLRRAGGRRARRALRQLRRRGRAPPSGHRPDAGRARHVRAPGDRRLQGAARGWLVDEIHRTPAGKPDYRWAKDTTEERPPTTRTPNTLGAPT